MWGLVGSGEVLRVSKRVREVLRERAREETNLILSEGLLRLLLLLGLGTYHLCWSVNESMGWGRGQGDSVRDREGLGCE